MSLKPAKKFVLGAVYAVEWNGRYRPAVCIHTAKQSARLRGVGMEADNQWDTLACTAYRIRARDWDSFEPEMTEFEKSLPFGYPGARAAYPDCTCSLGNTIEARRHYEMCALKEGK